MPNVQLPAQVHGAVYFQYPDCDSSRENEIIQAALELVEIELANAGRRFTVPGEAKIGYNWAVADPKCKIFADGNPEGLTKWSASSPDKRTRVPDMERRL